MTERDNPGHAGSEQPGRPGESVGSGRIEGGSAGADPALERRRRDLEAALASRRAEARAEAADRKPGGMSGFAQAIKISSEFIAGILVGAGLGWLLDYLAGTSPWGLIVFLLLGFCAGVLNVLRSTGQVAEFGRVKDPDGRGGT